MFAAGGMFPGGGFDFPVFFFEGEQEMYVGDVSISPSVEYKSFQFTISRKIGVSPNQISIYLVDRRKNPKPPFSEERRKLPITGKVDFGSICRHVGCFFLVVLKRTRKFRNRREKTVSTFEFDDISSEYNFPQILILDEDDQATAAAVQSMQNASRDRMQRLVVERENQRMGRRELGLNHPEHTLHDRFSHHSVPCPGLISTHPIQAQPMQNQLSRIVKMPRVFCAECADSSGETTPFHPCANDSILLGHHKSMFGPITQPTPQVSSDAVLYPSLFSPAAE